jgi:hypothetical protein
MVALM